MIILTVKEKTLLYLTTIPQDFQRNIETMLNISHSETSKSLGKLKEKQLIKEEKGYVKDEKRKVKTYSLTEIGRAHV